MNPEEYYLFPGQEKIPAIAPRSPAAQNVTARENTSRYAESSADASRKHSLPVLRSANESSSFFVRGGREFFSGINQAGAHLIVDPPVNGAGLGVLHPRLDSLKDGRPMKKLFALLAIAGFLTFAAGCPNPTSAPKKPGTPANKGGKETKET
jgi:hypothetical protein